MDIERTEKILKRIEKKREVSYRPVGLPRLKDGSIDEEAILDLFEDQNRARDGLPPKYGRAPYYDLEKRIYPRWEEKN